MKKYFNLLEKQIILSFTLVKILFFFGLLCTTITLAQTQQQRQQSSNLEKDHEEIVKRLHEAQNVMSKYYYEALGKRTNVFICAQTEEQLHVSRVDDGICDCCDGSDEPNKAWCKSATPCLSYEDKLKRLKAWLMKTKGTNIDDVEGAMFTVSNNIQTKNDKNKEVQHNGIKILKNGNRGDKILSIPLGLIFTAKIAEESGKEQGRLISMLRPYLSKPSYVALVLLNEMNLGTESKFFPWISTLPLFVKNIVHTKSVNTFLTAQQPASSLVIDMSNNVQEAVFSAYKRIRLHLLDKHPKLFSKSKYSIGRFIHAYTIVNSRAFSLQLSPPAVSSMNNNNNNNNNNNKQNATQTAEPEIGLVPFADFLNHHHEAVSLDKDGNAIEQFQVDFENNVINFYLGQDYAKDNEIFLNYGAVSSPAPGHITDGGSGSNAHSLHHFGFLNPNNPLETVHVSLEYALRYDQSSCGGVTETGNLEEWRKQALLKTDLAHVHYLSFKLDGDISMDDRKALRLWTICPGQAVEMGMKEISSKMESGELLDEANEVAIDWMIMLCLEQILLDHKTGLEEDVILLQNGAVSRLKQPDYFNSILYISTVKRILRAGIIGGMKNLYETYRRAAANWMEVEEGKIAMGANTENVDNYMKWIEELNVWRSKYLIWKKQNYKY